MLMLGQFAADSENQHLQCQCTLQGNSGSSERVKVSWGLEIDRRIDVTLAVIWMVYRTSSSGSALYLSVDLCSNPQLCS